MSDFRFEKKIDWDKHIEEEEPQEFRCDNCNKIISEEDYESNNGYCEECDYTYN